MTRSVQTNLVMDVGMNNGDDTAFYLAKGFQVVAIEANPTLVERARSRFAREIEAGQLTLLGVAIHNQDGAVEFFDNSRDNTVGSLSSEWAEKMANARGGKVRRLEVPGRRMEGIFQEHGVPYYLKIDIETADRFCLEALSRAGQRPRYVSCELDLTDFEETFLNLRLLWDLGYRKFKIVNQVLHHLVRLPNPAREGRHVDYRFTKGMSGPFGEETPGDWLSLDLTAQRYFWLRKRDRFYTRIVHEGKVGGVRLGSLLGPIKAVYNSRPVSFCRDLLFRIRGHQPSGWYDLHAKLDQGT